MARRTLPAAPADTASGYVRLSEAAGTENLSRDGMIADVVAEAARLGKQLIGPVHVDDGKSGAIRNRPEFMAWLDDVREARADTLIAWHVDRMTREGVNVAAQILDAIEGKDPVTGRVIREPARLVDTKGLDSQGDDTAFRFRFLIAAEVARAERERMRDRSRAMHRRAKEAGRWAGGTPPMGFRIVDNPDGPGKVLEIVPEEAAALTEASARLMAGTSRLHVVRWLNAAGPAPRRAAEWSLVTMRQALLGERVGRDILGPAAARAMRQLFAPRPSTRRGGRVHSRLLSGLLTCHSCGSVLQVNVRGAGYVTYGCKTPAQGRACRQPVGISATQVDKYMEGYFLGAYGHLPAVVQQATVRGADALALAEDAKAAALARLGVTPTAEAFADLQEVQARLDELARRPTERVVRNVPTGRTIAEEWAAAPSVHERQAMLASFVQSIVVHPGTAGRRTMDPSRLEFVRFADEDAPDYNAE